MNARPLIALPKGRVFEPALDLLNRAGIGTKRRCGGSRRLTFSDDEQRYDFVSLKPADIPVYVESGAVEAGVVGTDILRELEADVYEPVDLHIGGCRLVLAAPQEAGLDFAAPVRIATKYPRTAERYFRSRDLHVQIVKLEGSVEIAPLLGLADGIVDLIETGTTLKENGLSVVQEIARVSSKLIVNRIAMKLQADAINRLILSLDRAVYAHS